MFCNIPFPNIKTFQLQNILKEKKKTKTPKPNQPKRRKKERTPQSAPCTSLNTGSCMWTFYTSSLLCFVLEPVPPLSAAVSSSPSLSNCCCLPRNGWGDPSTGLGEYSRMIRSRKSFFLEQKGIVMANRWREQNPNTVCDLSPIECLAFRSGSAGASPVPAECSWDEDLVSRLQAPALPPSGFNGQHSPAVNMDWRETYTKNNITEKQNKSIFSRSREHIFAFQLCDRLGFTLARPRLLKSTDRKENELWIVLCPIVNLPKSKWGNRGFCLCLTTAWQHPKCKMESPGAPQRFPNRGMGQEKQGPRLPVQQLVSEGPSPALRKPLDI